MINNKFKSGKYTGKSYLDVWNTDKSYLYWLSENMSSDFWKKIVREFEHRDKQLQMPVKKKYTNFPSIEKVREYFKDNPILGFDMSDYIASLYKDTPDGLKQSYFESLLERNK